jgi:FMN phosphatase YigB (HAD superfamily)|tara:strand:+ start:948 stop:1784 length:837 start_codon:yes stop_codon:yes gene_type:complete
VITFDLDDTLWPTGPVVTAANQAFVSYCQARIPGFPDCDGVNEYMKRVRQERMDEALAKRTKHYPLSFASLRIAAGYAAAIDQGCPPHDAIAVVARGYHIAWIPARGKAAQAHLFPGVHECFKALRQNYPDAVIGSITNGLGSAAGAGLGKYFDFEISADAALDEEIGLHDEFARKPGLYAYEQSVRRIREIKGDALLTINHEKWIHVGDDVVNDCQFAKSFGAKTVLIAVLGVTPYQPGGGLPDDTARKEQTLELEKIVDATLASVGELPELLKRWS